MIASRWKVILMFFCAFAIDPLVAKEDLLIGVERVVLKMQPKFLSSNIATLKYGDSVTALETQGDWIRVKASSDLSGWIHRQSIGERKAILADVGNGKTQNSDVSDDEVSLAAKGFSAEHEKYYQSANTQANFSAVDQIEDNEISSSALLDFANTGGLNVP